MSFKAVPRLRIQPYLEGTEADRSNFIEAFVDGLKEYGFVTLIDPPIDSSLVSQSYNSIEKFFKQPFQEKIKLDSLDGGQRGYTTFGKEKAKDSNHPDLKEFWHTGRTLPKGHSLEGRYSENRWPTSLPKMETSLTELYSQLDRIAGILLQALETGLGSPPGTLRNLTEDGNSILRSIHYPALDKKPPQGSVRAAAHEDINLLTLLMGATSSGLELLDRNGDWLSVDSKEGEIVVDSGDMLSRITNGFIPSTTHRVVNPEDFSKPRYSMPFFVHPHPDAELKCLEQFRDLKTPEPPIRANEFLIQRLRANGMID